MRHFAFVGRYGGLLVFLTLAAAASLACTIPGLVAEPTPPPAPTPEGDTIFFDAPFATDLEAGRPIPGTQIMYVQPVNNLYELSIDGLQAYRQVGDSLTWRGVVAPGVFGDYRLRLRSNFLGELQAEGQVDIAVFNPTPVEIPPTQAPDARVYLSSIPISYFVPEGNRIPGTSLIYEGRQSDIAELSGTAGYPFFALDDSLLWVGKLRNNVFIRYNLRVSSLTDQGLGLTGTAELWVNDV